jgi:hypothetical protein
MNWVLGLPVMASRRRAAQEAEAVGGRVAWDRWRLTWQ